MAFANPLVIHVDAGTKSLPKINQDSYGSEYYLREATQEFRVRIRHTRESATKDGKYFERHNVEITRHVFEVAGTSPDLVYQTYFVLRNEVVGNITTSGNQALALADFATTTVFGDLIGWLN